MKRESIAAGAGRSLHITHNATDRSATLVFGRGAVVPDERCSTMNHT